MGNIFKDIKALKSTPKAILIPYIKAANELFHQLLPLLPFEPSISDRLQKSLMEDLI